MPLVSSRWVRIPVALALVWVAFGWSIDGWRSMEAALSVFVAREVSGWDQVGSTGGEILIVSRSGGSMLINIAPTCSSLAVVLVLATAAALLARGDPRRRFRGFALGATVVVAGNLARVTATVLVGIWNGPAAVARFHDGIAPYFAAAFLLIGLAAFTVTLWPPASRQSGEHTVDVLIDEPDDGVESPTALSSPEPSTTESGGIVTL